MEKIETDCSTTMSMSVDEAKDICKLGQLEECCAFLVAGKDGFQCIRMAYPLSVTIMNRLKKGTMNAKGEGMWKNCPWKNELED